MAFEGVSPFHRRLHEAVGRESQNSFAKRAGISQGTFNRIWNGGDPSLDSLIAISNAAGVTVGWLANGEVQPDQARSGDDESVLTYVAVVASAGRGAKSFDTSTGRRPFSTSVLQQLGLEPSDVALLDARGQSMLPTISDGDLLLVDVRKETSARPIDGLIYVLSIDDDLFVKRLRKTVGAWMMVSDNRELYPEEQLPTDRQVIIHGRVVWAGKQL